MASVRSISRRSSASSPGATRPTVWSATQQLERLAHVVRLADRRDGERLHEVSEVRLHLDEPFGDEPGQRLLDGTAGDAVGCRELLEAELLAGCQLARGERFLQARVDLVVEIRARQDG